MADAAKNMNDAKANLILQLFEHDIVKFGDFKLKSGIMSPIYFDIRTVVSYPNILATVAELMWDVVAETQFDLVCGVPYTALPIATVMSIKHNKPMIMKRKEKKAYGTKKLVEGVYQPGQSCLIVEDLVTSGMSVFETVDPLREVGLKVTDVVVLLDREQGGKTNVENGGLKLHSVLNVTEILKVLVEAMKITVEKAQEVQSFVKNNQVPINPKKAEEKAAPVLSFGERSKLTNNQWSKQMLDLMERKKTNLCASADLTNMHDLLSLAMKVGEHICLLKVHIDIIKFDSLQELREGIAELEKIAKDKDFMIFEDRKFADIGNTMLNQFTGGMYKISSWANITNAHPLPGDGVISGFKKANANVGLLLLAQMSCKGNLITEDYTKKTVTMAEANHEDLVTGFICQQKLSDVPGLIHMTPGVNLHVKGDSLGQQYNTPDVVVGQKGTDIIIVGRGIYKADNQASAAKQYRDQAWAAYEARLSKSSAMAI